MDNNGCALSSDDVLLQTEDDDAWLQYLFLADFHQQFRIEDYLDHLQPLTGSPALSEPLSAATSLSGESDTGKGISHSHALLRCIRKKESKVKANIIKTQSGKKKAKGLKYGFRIKADNEVVEDGYKWHKYGRKCLKSSPYPRNYYKCSAGKCGVKKRVDRDPADNGLIIVTYEGFHNHECPSASYYCIADI